MIGIAALIILASQATNLRGALHSESYSVIARFTNVGDLKPRAPVTIGGVKVGSVESVELDPLTYEAVVTIRISTTYDNIPNDTLALIQTSGLLGDQYIGLEPGGSPDPWVEGDEILITQSAVVLEQLIGKFMFNAEKAQEESQ